MASLVVDNGAGRLKYGFDCDEKPRNVFHGTAKINKTMQVLNGDQVDSCQNGSMLLFTRPCDRGYINNWKCEIDVWTRMLETLNRKIPMDSTSLVVTEPPLNPESIQNCMNELVFEYFGFEEYFRKPSSWFSCYEFCNNSQYNSDGLDSCLVVDSGFSFSHAYPFIDGKSQNYAVSVLVQLFYQIITLTHSVED